MAKAFIGFHEGKKEMLNLNTLTRHAFVVGSTGSGKTVMCKILAEEALAKKIPVIAIDPKGDISGLAVFSKKYDFRPFAGKAEAKRIAQSYFNKNKGFPDAAYDALKNVKARVYTPKSGYGIRVSLLPSLAPPKKGAEELAGPVGESIVSMSGVKGMIKDKASALISQILLKLWQEKKKPTYEELIEKVKNPPFSTIGSLPIDEFLKEADRLKAAASINLLLSSPSKQALSHGEELSLDIRSPGLSVFDLRFCTSMEEKQLAVEAVLQELYSKVFSGSGSERLKCILYIDEIAGILPPPPSNPPCKKLLELLIRQARAFGLGLVLATQSPGDIDYKLMGNLGTRLIGRLRTENDIQKSAIASDISFSELKELNSKTAVGEIIYSGSQSSKIKLVKARWLYTFHKGPLRPEHIKWINNPAEKPKVSGSLDIKQPKQKPLASRNKEQDMVSAGRILASVGRKPSQKNKPLPVRKEKPKKILSALIKVVKNHSDDISLKISAEKGEEYIPYLKIVVGARPYRDIEMPLQGPFLFDLTAKSIPIGNFLRHVTFRQLIHKDISIAQPKASIVDSVEYALREAKAGLSATLFESTFLKNVSYDKEEIVKLNHNALLDLSRPKLDLLKSKHDRRISELKKKIRSAKSSLSLVNKKLSGEKARRAVKKLIGNKKLSGKTKQMKQWEKRKKSLRSEIERLKNQEKKLQKEYAEKKDRLLSHIYEKSLRSVKQVRYNPAKKDLMVYATILLAPRKKLVQDEK
jgi:hypothetical protein